MQAGLGDPQGSLEPDRGAAGSSRVSPSTFVCSLKMYLPTHPCGAASRTVRAGVAAAQMGTGRGRAAVVADRYAPPVRFSLTSATGRSEPSGIDPGACPLAGGWLSCASSRRNGADRAGGRDWAPLARLAVANHQSAVVDALLEHVRLLPALRAEGAAAAVRAAAQDAAHWELTLAEDRGIAVNVDILAALRIAVAPTLMRQILSRLISNAVLHNRDGGTVTVTAVRGSRCFRWAAACRSQRASLIVRAAPAALPA